MTRLAYFSDLHLEASGLDLDVGDSTVVAALGDIEAPIRALTGADDHHEAVWWLRQRVSDRPVLFVPGNHDYERNRPWEALAAMRRAAEGSNVIVLWNEAVTLDGVRYIGSPLWSDPTQGDENPEEVLELVRLNTDLKRSFGADGRPLDGHWLVEQHRQARAFIADELAADHGLPKVVLTHWAPSVRSQHPDFAGTRLAKYWACDCEDLVAQAHLWLHGHIHDSVNYRVGDDPTKGLVLSNPRGRSDTFGLSSNPRFQMPAMVTV